MNEAVRVHACDRNDSQENVITNTYNPENGIAYYFTKHGNQIHNQMATKSTSNQNFVLTSSVIHVIMIQ